MTVMLQEVGLDLTHAEALEEDALVVAERENRIRALEIAPHHLARIFRTGEMWAVAEGLPRVCRVYSMAPEIMVTSPATGRYLVFVASPDFDAVPEGETVPIHHLSLRKL